MKKTSHKIIRDVSIARALSKLGHCSRKQGEQLVREGKVRMNGVVVLEISRRCSLLHDKITVEGKTLEDKTFLYILMNKPAGVVSTRSDERGRKTVYDVLGEVGKWVFPVGRLDQDTSGLLLFTNDHQLGERLTSPSSGVPKTYRVLLDRPVCDEHLEIMKNGMTLEGVQLMPAKARRVGNDTVELIICEGKNRQVRRMCEQLGYTVRSLEREAIGHLTLQGLKPGETRRLKPEEIRKLERNQ